MKKCKNCGNIKHLMDIWFKPDDPTEEGYEMVLCPNCEPDKGNEIGDGAEPIVPVKLNLVSGTKVKIEHGYSSNGKYIYHIEFTDKKISDEVAKEYLEAVFENAATIERILEEDLGIDSWHVELKEDLTPANSAYYTQEVPIGISRI